MFKKTYIIIFLLLSFIVICAAHVGFSADKKDSQGGGYVITYPSLKYKEPIREKQKATTDEISPVVERDIEYPVVGETKRAITSSESETALAVKEQMIRALKKQLEMKDKKIDILEERVERITQKLHERETELFMMQPKKAAQVYEVKRGDSLWKIAARKDTYSNPYMWIKIYNSNMSKIHDPNLIYPGQLFDIPK